MRYNQRDIVWVNFPFTNGAGSKRRPALVISNSKVNQTGDYILVQITSKNHKDALSFSLKNEDYEDGMLQVDSFIRIHKVFILNETLISGKATTLSSDCFGRILNEIRSLFL